MNDEGAAHPLPQSLHTLDNVLIPDQGQYFPQRPHTLNYTHIVSMSIHFERTLHPVSTYLSFGDCVHDSDSAERSQVVTAGMVVHLRHKANQRAAGGAKKVMQVKKRMWTIKTEYKLYVYLSEVFNIFNFKKEKT